MNPEKNLAPVHPTTILACSFSATSCPNECMISVIMSSFLNIMCWCWIGQSYSWVTDTFVFWLITYAFSSAESSSKEICLIYSGLCCLCSPFSNWLPKSYLSHLYCLWQERLNCISASLCVYERREKMCKIEAEWPSGCICQITNVGPLSCRGDGMF